MAETLRSLPLTDLSDDEKSFREVVRDFAEEKVRPLVRKMDEESKIPRDLIDACFELGIMGVEIPEQYGGAGATFFMSTLVVEELARVDPSVAVLVTHRALNRRPTGLGAVGEGFCAPPTPPLGV